MDYDEFYFIKNVLRAVRVKGEGESRHERAVNYFLPCSMEESAEGRKLAGSTQFKNQIRDRFIALYCLSELLLLLLLQKQTEGSSDLSVTCCVPKK